MTAERIDDWRGLVASALGNAGWGWSIGVQGAIAEFHRADEAVALGEGTAVTALGAIRISAPDGAVAWRYRLNGGCGEHGGSRTEIALCLPEDEAAMPPRTVLTEMGPDHDALRPEDRTAVLFDLGLDLPHVAACVRTADPRTIAALREGAGRSLIAEKNPLLRRMVDFSPHRVFFSRVGRIEVYQPIPAPGGKSPTGPHTHLLTGNLRRGRGESTPWPGGFLACLNLHPPS
jgi:hypothetical protein